MKLLKLIFDLQEIPEGKSTKAVHIDENELSLSETVDLNYADVSVDFYKTDHFVQVKFTADASVRLICDRSLEPFDKKISGSFTILYDPEVDEEEIVNEKDAVKQIPTDSLELNITKEVRDTIMLELPVRKLHPDYFDHNGNPVEFETKRFGPEPDEEDSIDPRWAELKKLK